MSDIKSHTFDEAFVTEGDDTISAPTVAYQSWGSLNEARNNVIVVCHALTGNTSANEWFHGIIGPGKALDPEQHFIICPNSLGSCYGSSGPVSLDPETGQPLRADFPEITIRDMVRLQQQLLDHLQIASIELVIGGSMGGMQALEWSIMDDRPQASILIGMGKEHSPWTIGISHAQRQAIFNDPNWEGGYYSSEKPPRKGLALARMIAMISYRTDGDYRNKFGRLLQDGSDDYQVESYLNYQGGKLVDRFDAVSYVRLTQAMDSHDVGRDRVSSKDALQEVDIPVLVIGTDSDLLYPVHEQQELAQLLPNGRYHEIESIYGHDAFLIEFEQMNNIIAPFLAETSTPTIYS
ncbi:homoserine O-acetyltransferase MetX [Fodinibius salsisoli]|uniref:Homoserine O-acetyltransferase n=1 Tax=Fodinibius salsisoli TaxID=2820877 RepID=A0ABT3PNS0_9BACT|nr:homoserine O-acetyltransferase [Fodinibius salsisoli]MCW9707496.1 homoserine O-acetyltransferase [Fodinibius salsisoli]